MTASAKRLCPVGLQALRGSRASSFRKLDHLRSRAVDLRILAQRPFRSIRWPQSCMRNFVDVPELMSERQNAVVFSSGVTDDEGYERKEAGPLLDKDRSKSMGSAMSPNVDLLCSRRHEAGVAACARAHVPSARRAFAAEAFSARRLSSGSIHHLGERLIEVAPAASLCGPPGRG